MKLRLALIGFGGMGNYHLKQMKASGLFEIVGIYDNKPEKIASALHNGYHAYSSAEELMSDRSVQAVLIATPNEVHADYVKMSCMAGKHVICEKPVTLNSNILQDMINSAKQNNVIFTVNQNRRWDKDFLTIAQVVNSGEIGETYKIESNVTGSHGIPGDWRKVKVQGGGMIYDWGVHLVDQALQLIDSKVVSVYCTTSYIYGFEVDDGVEMTITFANDFVYKINIDTNTFVNLPRWMIYGENGTAIVNDWNNRGKIVCVKQRFDRKNKGIKAGNGFTKTMANRSNSTIKKNHLPKVTVEEHALYKNFIKTINGECTQVVTHTELLRVMMVLECAFLSAENKEIIHTEI